MIQEFEKQNIAETKTTTIEKPFGGYWETLQKNGIPNYLFLGEELVLIVGQEKRKRKQIYFYIDDGRYFHASYFKKVNIKVFIRDYKLSQLGLQIINISLYL